MMTRLMTTTCVMMTALATLGSTGCAPGAERPAVVSQSTEPRVLAAEFQQLQRLYDEATAPRRRAVRKPIRDQQDRALAVLAARAGELAATAQAWTGEPLTTDDPQHAAIMREAAELQASLTQLCAAASARDRSGTRQHYRRALESYQRISSDAPPPG